MPTTKKTAKRPVAKSKKTKKSAVKSKAKSAVRSKINKSTTRKPVKKAGKKPTKRASAVKAKSSRSTKKPVERVRQKQVIPPVVIPHGQDQHFIPTHSKVTEPIGVQQSKQVEKQFHNHEETAMHQENVKVKQAMTNRSAMKKIFRVPRRS